MAVVHLADISYEENIHLAFPLISSLGTHHDVITYMHACMHVHFNRGSCEESEVRSSRFGITTPLSLDCQRSVKIKADRTISTDLMAAVKGTRRGLLLSPTAHTPSRRAQSRISRLLSKNSIVSDIVRSSNCLKMGDYRPVFADQSLFADALTDDKCSRESA